MEESSEFLKRMLSGKISKELEMLSNVQIRNMNMVNEATKKALENLGLLHDEIKTKVVREELEREMNNLASIIMENEREEERMRKILGEI